MSKPKAAGENVVFSPTESKILPGFFEVPGFSHYLVSPCGEVWYKRKNSLIFPRENKTSKGSYLAIAAWNGQKFVNTLVHHMVALAFHGPPQGDRNQVNHKDGDKHNNHFKNLEWVTRTENLIHAYKTGLRTDVRCVLCVDHQTGEAQEFYSMREVGRHFGWTKGEVWRTIRDHAEKKYHDRYTFHLPQSEDYRLRRRESKEQGGITRDIAARNYRTQQVMIFPDQGSAELMTHVKRGTINFSLNLASEPYRLIKGWVFKYMDDPADWPDYSEEMVEISFLRKAAGQPIEVTDTTTNTTCKYTSINSFAESLDEHPNTIRRALKKTPGRFRHFDIKNVM